MALVVVFLFACALASLVVGGFAIHYMATDTEVAGRTTPAPDLRARRVSASAHALVATFTIYGPLSMIALALASTSDGADEGAVAKAVLFASLAVGVITAAYCGRRVATVLESMAWTSAFVVPWGVVVLMVDASTHAYSY